MLGFRTPGATQLKNYNPDFDLSFSRARAALGCGRALPVVPVRAHYLCVEADDRSAITRLLLPSQTPPQGPRRHAYVLMGSSVDNKKLTEASSDLQPVTGGIRGIQAEEATQFALLCNPSVERMGGEEVKGQLGWEGGAPAVAFPPEQTLQLRSNTTPCYSCQRWLTAASTRTYPSRVQRSFWRRSERGASESSCQEFFANF